MHTPEHASTFEYLRTVLGIRTLMRSDILEAAPTVETEEGETPANTDFHLFGPATAPFGFVLTSMSQFENRDRNRTSWKHFLNEADATQLGKMILATGHAPESVQLLFINENRLNEMKAAELQTQLQATRRWVVMGPAAVSFLWQNRSITTVRGQVLTHGTTYLWPTWGIWEMNANPQLKREVWADMKRAFQGLMIEAPSPQGSR